MINQDFSFKEFNYLIKRGDYLKYFKTDENTIEANKNQDVVDTYEHLMDIVMK